MSFGNFFKQFFKYASVAAAGYEVGELVQGRSSDTQIGTIALPELPKKMIEQTEDNDFASSDIYIAIWVILGLMILTLMVIIGAKVHDSITRKAVSKFQQKLEN